MKKSIKYMLVVVGIIMLVIIYRVQYIKANEKYKEAPVKFYRMGEEVPFERDITMDFTMEGYSIKVNDAEVMTYEEFLKKYNIEGTNNMPDKVYDVSVTLKNKGADEKTGVNFMDFYLQKNAAISSLEVDLYAMANPDVNGSYAVALRNDSEMEFHLPFALWKENFRRKTWDNIENYGLNFVATLYPNKKIVSLQK